MNREPENTRNSEEIAKNFKKYLKLNRENKNQSQFVDGAYIYDLVIVGLEYLKLKEAKEIIDPIKRKFSEL